MRRYCARRTSYAAGYLVRQGADVQVRDNEGRSVFDYRPLSRQQQQPQQNNSTEIKHAEAVQGSKVHVQAGGDAQKSGAVQTESGKESSAGSDEQQLLTAERKWELLLVEVYSGMAEREAVA